MDIIKALKGIRISHRQIRDNDFFSDRLCHRHTNVIILLFIAISTLKRLFSSPINCWIPAELKRYEKYMNRYCWVKGTYYVKDFNDLEEITHNERHETLLRYYQWVQIILLFQAFLFYFPRILWTFISNKILNYDLFEMVDAAIKYETYGSDQERIFRFLTSNLTQNFQQNSPFKKRIQDTKIIKLLRISEDKEFKREKNIDDEEKGSLNDVLIEIDKSISKLKLFRYYIKSRLLMISYFIIKIIYLLIALSQIFVMNIFLSSNKHKFYGQQIIESILKGESDIRDHLDSRIFPRITGCDITTRELGTSHTYSIQCILSLNLFYERIYVFLWFWVFIVILPFLCYDIISWTLRIFLFNNEYMYKFIKRRIKIFNNINTKKEKYLLKIFTQYYIGADGVFVLRLIERNSNAGVVSELLNKMWNEFCNKEI